MLSKSTDDEGILADDSPLPAAPRESQRSVKWPDRREDDGDYRALFEDSPLPAWVEDVESLEILAANRAARERFQIEKGARSAVAPEGIHVHTTSVRFAGRAARLQEAAVAAASPVGEANEGEERLARAEQARADAEAANRAKDEFLAMLSHELRAPLGSILIWTQLLRTGGLDEPATARALGMIERSTETLEHFIEDLLDISRIIAGKLSLEVRPTDVASVVQAAVEEAQPAGDAKTIGLTTSLDRSLAPASGDPARLQQVVRNLLTNAIKFTPEGGSVHVDLDQVDCRARVRVTDTGVGIPQDYLKSVFERFRQVDSTSSRAHRGLGLGLAIVRHLVEMHGGTVTAESAGPGLGSTFTVLLPLVAGATPAAPLEDAGDTSDWSLDDAALAGVRILLVDDEEDARESLRVLLERSGADVLAVKSAPEALARIEGFAPHVLLSDIAMPEEDGYRLIRKVRALDPERGGRTPAAALTAYASREDRRNALLAGYQDHVPKPPDPAKLIALLAKLAHSGLAPATER
jgi:signal transduction histidine kinase/ActR/RegA family two-component response regulator